MAPKSLEKSCYVYRDIWSPRNELLPEDLRGIVVYNNLEYKTIKLEEKSFQYCPITLDSQEFGLKSIQITWSNKNIGLFLDLMEGTKTYSTIWFRRNDLTDGTIYSALEYNTVIESLKILKKIPYQDKRFWLCPCNNPEVNSFRIFLNGFTVRITNTGTNLIMILTKGRYGYFHYISE